MRVVQRSSIVVKRRFMWSLRSVRLYAEHRSLLGPDAIQAVLNRTTTALAKPSSARKLHTACNDPRPAKCMLDIATTRRRDWHWSFSSRDGYRRRECQDMPRRNRHATDFMQTATYNHHHTTTASRKYHTTLEASPLCSTSLTFLTALFRGPKTANNNRALHATPSSPLVPRAIRHLVDICSERKVTFFGPVKVLGVCHDIVSSSSVARLALFLSCSLNRELGSPARMRPMVPRLFLDNLSLHRVRSPPILCSGPCIEWIHETRTAEKRLQYPPRTQTTIYTEVDSP